VVSLKIGIITTLNTNIGDDFIRDGIIYLLDKKFGKNKYVLINKHNPFSIFVKDPSKKLLVFDKIFRALFHDERNYSRFILAKLISLSKGAFPLNKESKFDDCDLIIQSGAPVFWANAETNNYSYSAEWALPIWKGVLKKLSGKIPIFNLAAGSCIKYGQKSNFILKNEDNKQFLKYMLNVCDLVTVRDPVAYNMSKLLGSEVSLLPCTSIFSAKKHKLKSSKKKKFIVFNYMFGGGHFHKWDSRIDCKKWESISIQVVEKLSKKHEVKMLCHSKEEVELAKKTFPGKEILLFKKSKDQLNYLKDCSFGICNRVHASMGLASLGIPTTAISTDSRLEMTGQIGIPSFFVADKRINAKFVLDLVKKGIGNSEKENLRLKKLQLNSEKRFLELMKI
jgi:polysaccharide pyruvyl transferase WcaK-like protein